MSASLELDLRQPVQGGLAAWPLFSSCCASCAEHTSFCKPAEGFITPGDELETSAAVYGRLGTNAQNLGS